VNETIIFIYCHQINLKLNYYGRCYKKKWDGYGFYGPLSGIAKIGGYANIFFGIAFIVMYGVNYKALNK